MTMRAITKDEMFDLNCNDLSEITSAEVGRGQRVFQVIAHLLPTDRMVYSLKVTAFEMGKICDPCEAFQTEGEFIEAYEFDDLQECLGHMQTLMGTEMRNLGSSWEV